MTRPWLRWLLLVGLVGFAFVLKCACPPTPTLPIFTLLPPSVTASSVTEVHDVLFGGHGVSLSAPGAIHETEDRFIFRSDTLVIEVFKNSGGVWMENPAALWNPDSAVQLPDTSALVHYQPALFAYADGKMAAASHAARYASLRFAGYCSTVVVSQDRGGAVRTRRATDVQMRFVTVVRDPGRGGPAAEYDVGGGGGKLMAVFGEHGRPIGLRGVLRGVRGVALRAKRVPRATADRRFLDTVKGLRIVHMEAKILYKLAPPAVRQDTLAPVYVYRALALVNGDTVQVKSTMIPASDFGLPTAAAGDPPPRADADAPPQSSSTDERGTASSHEEQGTDREAAGVWYSADLQNGGPNVGGFLEALTGQSGDGWRANFKWGLADAWQGDWTNHRSEWVDAADIVYFSGHGSPSGWELADHDLSQGGGTKFFSAEDAAAGLGMASGGYFGAKDLEWMVISGCSVLADHDIDGSSNNVFEHWQGLFGGLHLLLGFGSEADDTPGEGALFARYALEGETLVDAWFRATLETEGSSEPRWAGVMWAVKRGVGTPFHDHLWGHGSVAKDPKNAESVHVMWTPL